MFKDGEPAKHCLAINSVTIGLQIYFCKGDICRERTSTKELKCLQNRELIVCFCTNS